MEVSVAPVRQVESASLTEEGKIKRIRGTAFSSRVSPALANRMISAIRGVFNDYTPDVWISSDHSGNKNSGPYVD